ncbi:cupin domain-containing protein [Azohydromonas lata]|uniref:Cupin domain-containing protein n=1 Tax=Azohydromonas lata TaxID=45677 RepID=A0ABU5IFX8_9BURK|nr:cupin domain-containing protein [Azohydromonas lata]MDZ5458027.1 cupin domain-containing protein [Azohydromonas lata]
MHDVRIEDAPRYDAPGHALMTMRRLQGREAGPADSLWIGLSVIEPGGGTTLSASGVEKFYVVLEGELEVSTQGEAAATATLKPLDSCRIAPGEPRRLHNRTAMACKVLLVMPHENSQAEIHRVETSSSRA